MDNFDRKYQFHSLHHRHVFFRWGNLKRWFFVCKNCAILISVIFISTHAGTTLTVPAKQYGFGALTAAAITNDGKTIASASSDGTIRLWDRGSSKVVALKKCHDGSVSSVSFSKDGSQLVSAGYDDNTIRIWDIKADTFVTTIKLTTTPEDVEFRPIFHEIVAACSDKTAKIFDSHTGDSLATLQGHFGVVNKAIWSIDGMSIATCCSYDSTARVWGASGSIRKIFKAFDMPEVFSVDFSPSGSQLMTHSNDRRVRIWDISLGKIAKSFQSNFILTGQAQFAPDGNSFLVYSSGYPRIVSVDITTGDSIRSYSTGSIQGNRDVVYVNNGASIFAAGKTCMRFLNASTGLTDQVISGYSDYTGGVAWSSDGKRVFVSGMEDTTLGYLIKVYNAENDSIIYNLKGYTSYINSIAVSANDAKVASGLSDGTVRITDASTGMLLRVLPKHDLSLIISHVAFTSGGSKLISIYRSSLIRIWDAETGDSLGKIPVSGSIRTGKVSPDGSKVLVASSTCNIFSLTTFDTIVKIGASGSITAAAYSPDGKMIVTSSSSRRELTIRNPETGDSIGVIGMCVAGIVDINFCNDGTRLLARTTDSIQIISLLSTTSMGMIRTRCVDAVFSPDGNSVLTTTTREGITAAWDISGLKPSNVVPAPVAIPRADVKFKVYYTGKELCIKSASSTISWNIKTFRLYTLTGQCAAEVALPQAWKGRLSLMSTVACGAYLYTFEDEDQRIFTGSILLRK